MWYGIRDYEYSVSIPSAYDIEFSTNCFVAYNTENGKRFVYIGHKSDIPEERYADDYFDRIDNHRYFCNSSLVTVKLCPNAKYYSSDSTYKFEIFGDIITIDNKMRNTPIVIQQQYDEVDYKALYEHQLIINSKLSDSILLCGDIDADGHISISDSIILNRYLAGTVDSLPCSDPPHVVPEDDLG